jgi:hypothetical protein
MARGIALFGSLGAAIYRLGITTSGPHAAATIASWSLCTPAGGGVHRADSEGN